MPHSSTMSWLTDSQLYLHSQGDDVHVWKCKKSSSVLVPMSSNDFDDLGKVTNHLDLVLHFMKWDEAKYKAMVNYISERRFLVNCQGLVIVEIYKFGQDGSIDLNVDPIYLRSLDVLQLDTYINCFGEQSVPFRALQYLEVDPNGSKAPQEETSPSPTNHATKLEEDLKEEKTLKKVLERDVNRLTAELANLIKNEKKTSCDDIEEANKKLTATLAVLTKKVVDLESKNKTLEGNVTKTTSDLAAQTNKVVDLESKIKTLEGNAKQMTSDLAVQTNKVAELESKNKTLEDNEMKTKADLAAQTNKVVNLESKNKTLEGSLAKATTDLTTRNNAVAGLESRIKTLEGNVTRLTADLAVRTNQLEASQQELNRAKNAYKEVWMNDDSAKNDWTGVEGLRKYPYLSYVTVLGTQGTFTTECDTTNVKARYSYKVELNNGPNLRLLSWKTWFPTRKRRVSGLVLGGPSTIKEKHMQFVIVRIYCVFILLSIVTIMFYGLRVSCLINGSLCDDFEIL